MTTTTQQAPSESWEALRKEIIKRIDAIDEATPYSTSGDPHWWLHMMAVQRAALTRAGSP